MERIEVTEEDTSSRKVTGFLKYVDDTQPFHQPPYNTVPGMFLFRLVEPYIIGDLLSLDLNFYDVRFYPFKCYVDVETTGNVREFLVRDEYSREDPIAKFIVTTNPSRERLTSKLTLVHTVARELLRHDKILPLLHRSDGEYPAVYERQLMIYANEPQIRTRKLEVGEIELDKSKGSVPIVWRNKRGERLADGKTSVSFIPERILKWKLEKKRKALNR